MFQVTATPKFGIGAVDALGFPPESRAKKDATGIQVATMLRQAYRKCVHWRYIAVQAAEVVLKAKFRAAGTAAAAPTTPVRSFTLPTTTGMFASVVDHPSGRHADESELRDIVL